MFDRHGRDDKKALFCAAQWRGYAAAGKARAAENHDFFVNNVQANIFWQNQFLDQDNDFIQDRFPYPFIEMNPEDMAEMGIYPGDLIEITNENGATQGMAYPTDTARRGDVVMVFGSPAGSQGNVVNPGVSELILPEYKLTFGNIRKLADAPKSARGVTFKSKEYKV